MRNYHNLWFKSFRLSNTSGHRYPIQLKLIKDQDLPTDVVSECGSYGVNPYSLLTECNSDYFTCYPASTKFCLKAKLKDKERGGLHFYSYYGWQPLQVIE